MSALTAEWLEDWDTRPFSGGYRGLHELAGEDFSGVVTAGSARLAMLNGAVVGVLGGSLADFEGASGTVHVAPFPALPLLLVMRERSDEVRAQYYTEETPIEEVDRTLTDGGFTGYVVLSENVLSGDYYLVYHGGRSMSVAFVGESERLLTADEAFQRANDEVGIYEVRPVDIEVQEIPEPADEPDADDAPDAESDDAGADEAGEEPDTPASTDAGADEDAADAEPDVGESAPRDDEPVGDASPGDVEADEPLGERKDAGSDARDAHSGSGGRRAERDTSASSGSGQASSERPSGGGSGAASTGGAVAGRLETRSIPSLDPGRTKAKSVEEARRSRAKSAREQEGQADASPDRQSRPTDTGVPESEESRPSGGESSAAVEERSERAGEGTADAADLRDELESREERVARLEERLESAESEREELAAERDELEESVDRLKSQLQTLNEDGEADEVPERQLGIEEAIDGTNLFVRYRSKGDPTLAAAHAGEADRSTVDDNLRLEYHTRFDADAVAVNGEPFDSFLKSTLQYRFVEWVIRELLYEIRDTGHAAALQELYDALPRIDRAELNGTVSVTRIEDGEEHRSQQAFDVVLRDRMGNPLVVTNLNDARSAASESMMASLITAAEGVGNTNETLAGAFLVTSSFFEPEALETAAESTSGGLLSRDKRKSFVKLTRKRGFHLCLVEAREGKFHLAVPEL